MEASVLEEQHRKGSSDEPLHSNILDSPVVQMAGGVGGGGGIAAYTLVAGESSRLLGVILEWMCIVDFAMRFL